MVRETEIRYFNLQASTDRLLAYLDEQTGRCQMIAQGNARASRLESISSSAARTSGRTNGASRPTIRLRSDFVVESSVLVLSFRISP